ncbi:MAG: hypothetical protein CL424_18195 [Acidimicrobiaceae bacterium]|nr:hypothetical protein [Acidimicrobiaceae bacterium]
MQPRVAVIGSLDTKSAETEFLAEAVAAAGGDPFIIDTSASGDAGVALANQSLELQTLPVDRAALSRLDRSEAMRLVSAAAVEHVARLVSERRIDAMVGAGGSNAALIFAAVANVVPFGVPKVLASTMAAVDAAGVIGDNDVTLMYPVADIEGLNSLTSVVLAQIAGAAVAMAQAPDYDDQRSGGVVAATMFGVTTACVHAARKLVEASGQEVIAFHATGTGGRSMEALADERRFSAILDITTTELADLVAGGTLSAGEERLDPRRGPDIPRVVAPGAVDMANFGPIASIPSELAGRHFYQHNDLVTLMRTTPEENTAIGRHIANFVANRPDSVVLLPLRGVSALDVEGGEFWDPDALDALFTAIRAGAPAERIIEVDAHINDEAFATAAVEALRRLTGGSAGGSARP